jgi:hypothetical protein
MNKDHQRLLHTLDNDLILQLQKQDVSPAPFARYVDDCATVFSGIETIAELVAMDYTVSEAPDPEQAAFALGDNATYRLLSLVRVIANRMEGAAEDLAQWARDRTDTDSKEDAQ